MKKLFIITIVFLICSFQSVFATDFELMVDTKNANPSEEVVINLTFSNNTGILGVVFDIEYDKERLILTDAKDKGILPGAVFSQSTEVYPYKMLWNSVSEKSYTNNGVLAELTFKVSDNAKEGEAFINVSYESDNVFDADLNNVDIKIKNGAIIVLPKETASEEHKDESTNQNDKPKSNKTSSLKTPQPTNVKVTEKSESAPFVPAFSDF